MYDKPPNPAPLKEKQEKEEEEQEEKEKPRELCTPQKKKIFVVAVRSAFSPFFSPPLLKDVHKPRAASTSFFFFSRKSIVVAGISLRDDRTVFVLDIVSLKDHYFAADGGKSSFSARVLKGGL